MLAPSGLLDPLVTPLLVWVSKPCVLHAACVSLPTECVPSPDIVVLPKVFFAACYSPPPLLVARGDVPPRNFLWAKEFCRETPHAFSGYRGPLIGIFEAIPPC